MDDMRVVRGFLGLVVTVGAGCIASTDTTDVSREPPCASDVALPEGGGLRDGCVFWEQRGRWEPGGAVGCE